MGWVKALRDEGVYVHAVRKAIVGLKESQSEVESRRLGRCAPLRPLTEAQRLAVLDYAIALSEARTEADVNAAVRQLHRHLPR
jgi:hypothetical protein